MVSALKFRSDQVASFVSAFPIFSKRLFALTAPSSEANLTKRRSLNVHFTSCGSAKAYINFGETDTLCHGKIPWDEIIPEVNCMVQLLLIRVSCIYISLNSISYKKGWCVMHLHKSECCPAEASRGFSNRDHNEGKQEENVLALCSYIECKEEDVVSSSPFYQVKRHVIN